jgi:hypothetical protein
MDWLQVTVMACNQLSAGEEGEDETLTAAGSFWNGRQVTNHRMDLRLHKLRNPLRAMKVAGLK